MREYHIPPGAFPEGTRLGDALTARLKLPLETIEAMLAFGAVVVRFRGKGPWERVRDGRLKLNPADQVQAVHDPGVLALPAFISRAPLEENRHYGVWWKPAGIMSQGTASGDHRSMLYAVERTGRKAFPVHRLDRETEGLMLVAYTTAAAAKLSEMFQKQAVHKTYMAVVCGLPTQATTGLFQDALDGKPAQTRYRVVRALEEGRLLVELEPLTGRLHQIRRHLALHGAGVWGDPKYGKNNKNREGMKLAATGLCFQDPWESVEKTFRAPASFAPAEV